MKLRNKKTGEIGELQITAKHYAVVVGKGTANCNAKIYCSLDKLNAGWEDYEEHKDHWHIGCEGDVFIDNTERYLKTYSSIGNDFETKEEAEKAVEKLKAWKLLKDVCKIKFNGIIRDERTMLKGVKLVYDRHLVTLDIMRECMDALNLLFGGEE